MLDNSALERLLTDDPEALGALVLDVWEGEPAPRPSLIRRASVATPHVAGYSFDGKVRGTLMLAEAFAEAMGEPPLWDAEVALEETADDALDLAPPDPALGRTAYLHALAQQMYAIVQDDARMRPLAGLPEAERGDAFSRLRKTYPRRRAFEQHRIEASAVPATHRAGVLALGVTLVQ
jgi:erythronate-4-phosphate dehydrogenase